MGRAIQEREHRRRNTGGETQNGEHRRGNTKWGTQEGENRDRKTVLSIEIGTFYSQSFGQDNWRKREDVRTPSDIFSTKFPPSSFSPPANIAITESINGLNYWSIQNPHDLIISGKSPQTNSEISFTNPIRLTIEINYHTRLMNIKTDLSHLVFLG